MDNPTGTFLHLQRLSTEDGPGIRTTVFLKGCLLRCAWCHNPESLQRTPEIQRVETNCIRCGTCIEVCPQKCLVPGEDFVAIDRNRCDACGICVQACPTGAMELLGIQVSVDDLFYELIKDLSYYQHSEGGVTLSGGEPALQADFCASLMKRLKSTGIHTALDTCGMTSQRNLAKILPHTDLVLYDLKEIDAERHKTFTGYPNQVILENLSFVSDYIREAAPHTRLWIRTPFIPGATATLENLARIGAYLAYQLGDLVERWELLAFNNLCRDKYRRLGIVWRYENTPLLTQAEFDQFENWAKDSGFPAERIAATGAANLT